MFTGRTILISFFVHMLVLCTATLSVMHAPLREKILMVKIETAQATRPPPNQEETAAVRHEAKKEKRKNLRSAGSLTRPPDRVTPPSEGRHNVTAVRNTQESEAIVEQPLSTPTVQAKAMTSEMEQGSPSAAAEGHSGSGDGGREKGGMGVSLYNKEGGSTASGGSKEDNENYIRRIQELIERARIYPQLARKRRQEGTVTVQFAIDTKGLPRDITIIRSTGFNLLDSAARDIITKAAPFPHVKGAIEVPITFKLSDQN